MGLKQVNLLTGNIVLTRISYQEMMHDPAQPLTHEEFVEMFGPAPDP